MKWWQRPPKRQPKAISRKLLILSFIFGRRIGSGIAAIAGGITSGSMLFTMISPGSRGSAWRNKPSVGDSTVNASRPPLNAGDEGIIAPDNASGKSALLSGGTEIGPGDHHFHLLPIHPRQRQVLQWCARELGALHQRGSGFVTINQLPPLDSTVLLDHPLILAIVVRELLDDVAALAIFRQSTQKPPPAAWQ